MSLSKDRKSIRFFPNCQTVSWVGRKSVLEIALAHDIEISHSCGGMGTCGTCRVFAEGGEKGLPPRNSLEREMAEDRGFQANERLACQMIARDEMKITIDVKTEEAGESSEDVG